MLINMRCNLYKPLRVNRYDVPHELFGGEDKFVENNPFRKQKEAEGLGVYENSVYVFQGFIEIRLIGWNFSSVIKIRGDDALPDIGVSFIEILRETSVVDVDVHLTAQLLQLLLYVPSSFHAPKLDEVLEAPLVAVVAFLPAIVTIILYYIILYIHLKFYIHINI